MPKNDEIKERDNLKAIAVGLLLISLIFAVTIFQSNLRKKKTSNDRQELSSLEATDSQKIEKITPEDLAKKIQNDSDLLLIDLRSEAQYQTEHIIDSINIPGLEITTFSNLIARNKKLVLIEDLGEFSVISPLVEILSDKGYENISYLEGGFDTWKNKLNPTVSGGDQKSFTDQAKVKYISSDELRKQLASESEKRILIDVRNSADFRAGHLPGAVNIFLDELEANRKKLPSRGEIILYDNNGVSVFKGSVRLFDLGFFNVFALSNGLDDWKKNGYELEQ